MQMPKMKTLCCDETEPNLKDADPNYTNPNLYDYNNRMETKTLDVQKMSLGKTTHIGLDLPAEKQQLEQAIKSATLSATNIA